MVEIKSPSLGLDGSRTPFLRSLAISRFMMSLSPDEKIICLGLVACNRSTMPLKLYVMMLDGIKNNRIRSNCFPICYVALTQPALK